MSTDQRGQLIALLEQERICGDPDRLEAERYRPGGIERLPGLRSPYTPITEEQAEQNRLLLLKWPEKPEDES